MKQDTITIVTVTYNCKDLLEETILSVTNQSYKDVEYIIIDAGSTDGTVDIIKQYEDKISYWISEPDEGIYYAMNKAIKMATGEWINFMNAGDTFAENGTVEYVMKNKTEDADLIYGNHLKRQSGVLKKAKTQEDWYKIMPFCHQTLFTKTSIMKANLFDTHFKLAADYNFIIKMYHEGKKFFYINKTIAIFDEGGFAVSNSFLMHIESLKILTYIGLDQKEIAKSWWYKSLKSDISRKCEKNEKEFKSLQLLYGSVQKLSKVSLRKHPAQKYIAYKNMLKTFHKIKKQFYIKPRTNKKIYSKNTYTVVSAVYNVEKYLDEYFKSITEQSLDFVKHIKLILVDDGSTDSSAEIIMRWKNLFPNNITYIKKVNGGVSSARNLGMQYVNTTWLTMIDPDDMINSTYFEEVDKCVINDEYIDVVSCNQIFYIEETKELKNHFLSYRFETEKKVVNPSNMQNYVQPSINSVFFKLQDVEKYQLSFDEKIVPVFEDGYFVNQLFLEDENLNIVFLKNAEYYYRKRLDNTSLVNTAWQKPSRYLDALEFGLLKLFIKAKDKYGDIPIYLQRFVLYQLQFYFKRIVNDGDKLEFLNQEELELFKTLLHKLFIYIDAETIEVCALGGLWHKYRLGFYNLYKDKTIFKQVCYLDGYDPVNKEIKLHYYAHSETQEKFSLNGKVLEPRSSKIIEHKFLDQLFVYEKIIYIPLDGIWEYFDVKLGNIETQISLNAKRYKNGIQVNDFINVAIKDD